MLGEGRFRSGESSFPHLSRLRLLVLRVCFDKMAECSHAMFVDQETESCLIPLNEEIEPSLGRLELANSMFNPPEGG